MQAVVLGIQLDENEASVLKLVFNIKDKKLNYLTPGKVKEKDAILDKLIKNGLIEKTIEKNIAHYSISNKGIEAYDLLSKDMVIAKGTNTPKAPKKDELAKLKASIAELKDSFTELKASNDELNKKLEKIYSTLPGILSATKSGNGSSDKSIAFEQSLVYEYNTLKAREFLSDGKVWHEQLKRIMIERHQYRDYEYDELLQQIKQKKLGMISLSQGKDKTWIEIRI